MKRSTAATIGIVVILVAVAVVVFLVVGRGGEPTPEPSPSAQPSTPPTATPSPTLNAALLDRRLTVLLAGIDSNAGRAAAGGASRNTDALLLASISADYSRLTLVSLPRDTVDVPLADGGVWTDKINGLYAGEGIETLVGAFEELYGVPLDYHVTLDMDDFAALVDAVGGVTVDPEAPISDPAIDLDVQPGLQELDAAEALAYVRSRVDQDYGRMGRQQEVFVDLVAQLVDPGTDLDLAALLDGLSSLETDLQVEDLPTLAEVARRAQDAEVTNLVIGPPLIVFEGDRGDGRGYILEPDVAAIRDRVSGLLADD